MSDTRIRVMFRHGPADGMTGNLTFTPEELKKFLALDYVYIHTQGNRYIATNFEFRDGVATGHMELRHLSWNFDGPGSPILDLFISETVEPGSDEHAKDCQCDQCRGEKWKQ